MHRNRIILVLIICCLSTLNCLAQSVSINTDRPDQSDGTYTLTKNAFQIENGITLAKETFVNNLMLRYGATNSTEIRLLIDAGKENGLFGLKPLTISAKQRILEQKKWIPSMTLVGYATFGKLASNDFQENKISTELKLAFENELTDKFAVGYNIGQSESFENLTLSLGFYYTPIDKISTFVEYFSTVSHFTQEHNFDTGILYLLSPVLQIDFAIGHSIFAVDKRFFTTFGISYLFN